MIFLYVENIHELVEEVRGNKEYFNIKSEPTLSLTWKKKKYVVEDPFWIFLRKEVSCVGKGIYLFRKMERIWDRNGIWLGIFKREIIFLSDFMLNFCLKPELRMGLFINWGANGLFILGHQKFFFKPQCLKI